MQSAIEVSQIAKYLYYPHYAPFCVMSVGLCRGGFGNVWDRKHPNLPHHIQHSRCGNNAEGAECVHSANIPTPMDYISLLW